MLPNYFLVTSLLSYRDIGRFGGFARLYVKSHRRIDLVATFGFGYFVPGCSYGVGPRKSGGGLWRWGSGVYKKRIEEDFEDLRWNFVLDVM